MYSYITVKKMIITFCGHSNFMYNIKDEESLLALFEKIIKNNQVDFYLGGYGNFDSFALKCAQKYKDKHNNAKIFFITPYLNTRLNERKDILLKTYDMILYPELESVPKKFVILKRNEWMIKQADYVFAYVKTHYGGAYKSLLYAHKHKITLKKCYT